MLTYETLRKMIIEEKNMQKLVKLPDNFFEEIKSYIDKKSKVIKSKEDEWELNNAKAEVDRLLQIREKKVLESAMNYVNSGAAPINLSPEEKSFFNSVVAEIKNFHSKRKSVLEAKPEKVKVLAFLQPVDRFVAINMKNYGPFKMGDISTIPEKNADILLEKKMAKEIKPE